MSREEYIYRYVCMCFQEIGNEILFLISDDIGYAEKDCVFKRKNAAPT
jgi:hypothetical protein